MKSHLQPLQIFRTTTALAALVLVGCANRDYTAPGIQPVEAKLIAAQYYWDRQTRSFSDEAITRLFRRSLEVAYDDGERSESHASYLVWALVSAGDERFARLLAQQPNTVQRRVLCFISGLWTHDHMHYPHTEQLWNSSRTDLDVSAN